jgi:hypothetical protein
MSEHDAVSCEDCVVMKAETNGHAMQVIIPCSERIAYWACLTCDQLEKWPLTEDAKATNDIFNSMMYIHCIDNLVYS